MSTGGPDGLSIDADLVRRLLAAQFPQWAQLPLSPVPRPGMDNATFRLGATLSARLPRFRRWAGQVEREHRWLPLLAPHLPLRISEPLATGEPGEGYPYPWSVYRWIEGDAITTEALADPLRAVTELAGFLIALRGIDPTDGPGPQWSNAFRGVPMGDPRDSIATEHGCCPRSRHSRGWSTPTRSRGCGTRRCPPRPAGNRRSGCTATSPPATSSAPRDS